MKKQITWIIGIFIAIFVATFIFYGVKMFMVSWYMSHYQEPPITVSTIRAELKTWNPFLSTVGSLKASNGVDVNSEVSGQILAIDFQSGEHVKQGDLLIQLNDSVDQQTLLRDEAKLRFDKIDFDRKELLLKENAVARTSVDAARAAYLQSSAAVQSDKVIIAQKKIRAPFSGKIGIRQVNVGQYITTGTGIVTLQALDPMYVDFSLPEQDLPNLKNGQDIHLKVDAFSNKIFQGKIIAINPLIDVNTRSVAVRAIIPNQDETLYPGLFAEVQVILPELKNVITVPQSAVTYSLYGDSIYVLAAKGKDKKGQPEFIAEQKYVKVGERRDNDIAVVSGINSGDTVVTSGQIKLHSGAKVLINNTVTLQ
jgi:membrane fusion protein (multidrug efflux system)